MGRTPSSLESLRAFFRNLHDPTPILNGGINEQGFSVASQIAGHYGF